MSRTQPKRVATCHFSSGWTSRTWMLSLSRSEDSLAMEALLDFAMARRAPTPTIATKSMYQCAECLGELVWISEGAACRTCGLVDSSAAILQDGESQPFINRCVVQKAHRYSRLVHFKDYLNTLCAASPCTLAPSELQTLQAALAGVDCTITRVKKVMNQVGIPKRHKKRIHSLLVLLNAEHKPVVMCPDDHSKLCKLFREAEYVWNANSYAITRKRKVFLSYSFLLQRFSEMIGVPAYGRFVTPLKNKRLRSLQARHWNRLLDFMHAQKKMESIWPLNTNATFNML